MYCSQKCQPFIVLFIAVIINHLMFCQAGQCNSGQYLEETNGSCKNCPRGTYNPDAGNETKCINCPISEEGRNRTTITVKTSNVSRCFTLPEIGTFTPNFGPISGGTHVTVKVKYWEKYIIAYVYMVKAVCDIMRQSIEYGNMTCVTGAVDNVTSGVGKFTFTMDKMFSSNDTFEYRPDPIVTEIDDLRTIVSGGLLVKIFGEYFDSVAQSYFMITRIHNGNTDIFYEPCNMITPQELHCKTPNVGRGMVHHLFNSRKKRQLTAPTFNDENNQFYAGMKMDGVREYTNISEAIPDYGQMLVYPDPVFYPFDEEDQIKRFNPDESGFLDIQGKHLNYACTIEDITVTIGRSKCNITFLATNMLTCIPLPYQPEIEASGFGKDGIPRVTVYVGYLIFVIGYLEYYTPVDEIIDKDNDVGGGDNSGNEILIGAIAGVILFLLLLIIIILVAAVLYRRKKEGRKMIKRLGSRMSQGPVDASRYIQRNGVLTTNVIYSDVNGKGFKEGEMTSTYDVTLPNNNRHREMSITVSPPDTPGAWSTNSGNAPPPFYINMNEAVEKDILSELEESLMLNVKECMIESDRLELAEVIGVGYFGKVHKAVLKNDGEEPKIVAVKTIQGNHYTAKDVGSFLEEAVLMKDFDHKNVLSLIGVVIMECKPLVVLPLMEYGDLKSYIRESNRRIKVRELLGFGQQIATGMSYLAKQKFVHRDLATRNCMLNKEMVVKIADFGLSRDIYKCDYYRVEDKHRPLPVRWMAIESLTSGFFSSKSDVWAFGVTLWELLTRGCSPYPDVDTFNIKSYVISGRRLSQPEHSPDEVNQLMARCWLEDPDERPSFHELQNEIADILYEDERSNRPEYAKLIDLS